MNYLKRNRGTILAVIGVWALAATVPAVAHGVDHALFAHEADKVDGKHAVGAGKAPQGRAGKLVATNSKGRLPTDIIEGVVLGNGAARANRLVLEGVSGADYRTFFRFRGLGKIDVRCTDTGWGVSWSIPDGVSGYWRSDDDDGTFDAGQTGNGTGNVEIARQTPTGQILVQAGKGTRASTRLKTVRITVVFDDESNDCFFHGHAATHGGVAIQLF